MQTEYLKLMSRPVFLQAMKQFYSSRAELILNNAKQEMQRRKEAARCTEQKFQCNAGPRKRLVYFQVSQVRTIFVFCLHGLSDTAMWLSTAQVAVLAVTETLFCDERCFYVFMPR